MAAVLPTVAGAIAVVSELAQALEAVSGIIGRASSQNRTQLSAIEWNQILAQANRAHQRAKAAISIQGPASA